MAVAGKGAERGRSVLVADDLSIGYVRPKRAPLIIAERTCVALGAGELVCLLGPNGAGKSTLIRTLAGMQRPLAGRILLQGECIHHLPVRDLARLISVVLTERIDVGALSALDLVALGRYPYTSWSGRLTPADEAMVRWAMTMVGAASLAERKVEELSDGERQKVMIARALAQQPLIMILDEPTAFLDLPRRVEIMGTLRRLARQTGQAILLSTHDLDLALRSADTIWLLASEGTLRVGAPEDLVLDGAFAAAFEMDGIEFDADSGSFRLHEHSSREIAFHGEGIPALWTRRALTREGFSARDNATGLPLTVKVEHRAGRIIWYLRSGKEQRICGSIAELIADLRAQI